MADFFSILKRKTRGSSSSSESGALTPKEKRFWGPSFETDDEVNIALDMAEDFGSKLQLVLQKLTSLESMVEGVLQRFNNLESSVNGIKVIPLKLFYYQTFLKLGLVNIDDMNIKKMQLKNGVTVLVYTSAGS